MEAAAKAGDGVGWANGEQSGITVGLPLWAQVSRVQALQSLALRAPRDKKLRSVVYDVNIGQVRSCVLWCLRSRRQQVVYSIPIVLCS